MKAVRRELGRAVYGLMWLAAPAIAVVLWPASQVGDLISGDRLRYASWLCWGLMVLGLLTTIFDDRVQAAIDAHNNKVFDGQPFLWPAKKVSSPGPGWFGIGLAGRLLGVVRLILVAEVIVQLFNGSAPTLTFIALPALFMSFLLMLRAQAGPVFGHKAP